MAQNCQNRQKLTYLCSYLLLTIHESEKSWSLYTMPICHNLLRILSYALRLCIPKLCIGKSRWVIKVIGLSTICLLLLSLLSTENRDISRFMGSSKLWNRRKLTYLCSYLLLMIHESERSWFLYTTPIRHTYWGYSVMHYDCACPSSV